MLKPSDPIAVRIRRATERGALSHALLFTGGGDRLEAARYAAAAMECRSADRPCGLCAACRKVFGGIHPDVITVRDEAHKNLSAEVVRAVRADVNIAPNEGERKVYIVPDCTLLTERDQNILLKTVEEGPPYAAFFFCAENAAVVLETLRSRCVELKLSPAAQAEDGGTGSEWATELCRSLGKSGAAAELTVRLEKTRPDREQLAESLAQAAEVLKEALLERYGRPSQLREASALVKNLTNAQIMRTIDILTHYRADCAFNIGVGQVLGALAAELEELAYMRAPS